MLSCLCRRVEAAGVENTGCLEVNLRVGRVRLPILYSYSTFSYGGSAVTLGFVKLVAKSF